MKAIKRKFNKIMAEFRNFRYLMRALRNLSNPQYIFDLQLIHQLKLNKDWSERNSQRQLMDLYASKVGITDQKKVFEAKEYKIFTQNGEDGILLYIFSLIGIKTGKFVDFGCGGFSHNTANLVINFNWSGLYIGGTDEAIRETKDFFSERIGERINTLQIQKQWITKDNINSIIENAGLKGTIDLLSVDIDSSDYWIWEAINVISPNVVLVEYNASFGPYKSVTVPYKFDFDPYEYNVKKWYHGASLQAMTKLGKQKGYSLVYCDSNGVNAFFVKTALLLEDSLKEMTPEIAYNPHFQREGPYEEQLAFISHLPVIEI